MWYLQALGAAISLALLREVVAGDDEPVVLVSERAQSWSYQDLSRCRTLWLECLLYGQVARSPRYPKIYLQFLAESAFAAAWAALDFWDADRKHKDKLEALLSGTAAFLETLKPERHRPGIHELRQRLQRISSQGESRTEVWAYLIGHWLHTSAGVQQLPDHEELADLGWPMASFGLSFWSKDAPYYRKNGELRRLVQPFDLSDAFGLYGPFEKVEDSRSLLKGEKLALASLVNTKGLHSPPVWDLEGLFGGTPGVMLTRTGHVHRQFAGDDLPEWFEAVEVTYEPGIGHPRDILFKFWNTFHATGDLLFYTTLDQREQCLQAWQEFKSNQPDWAVPHALQLRLCQWFEPAETKKQKVALQSSPVLRETCQKLDLKNSHLATKINAFASGFGEDEDVVLLAARYGLSDGLTLALRTVRYFSRSTSLPERGTR
jgi:hypothetical protein